MPTNDHCNMNADEALPETSVFDNILACIEGRPRPPSPQLPIDPAIKTEYFDKRQQCSKENMNNICDTYKINQGNISDMAVIVISDSEDEGIEDGKNELGNIDIGLGINRITANEVKKVDASMKSMNGQEKEKKEKEKDKEKDKEGEKKIEKEKEIRKDIELPGSHKEGKRVRDEGEFIHYSDGEEGRDMLANVGAIPNRRRKIVARRVSHGEGIIKDIDRMRGSIPDTDRLVREGGEQDSIGKVGVVGMAIDSTSTSVKECGERERVGGRDISDVTEKSKEGRRGLGKDDYSVGETKDDEGVIERNPERMAKKHGCEEGMEEDKPIKRAKGNEPLYLNTVRPNDIKVKKIKPMSNEQTLIRPIITPSYTTERQSFTALPVISLYGKIIQEKTFAIPLGSRFICVAVNLKHDFHKAIKYSLWSPSCDLREALVEAEKTIGPTFLLFFKQPHFIGLAEVYSSLRPNHHPDIWEAPYRSQGTIELRWHLIHSVHSDVVFQSNKIHFCPYLREGIEIDAIVGVKIVKALTEQGAVPQEIIDKFPTYDIAEEVKKEKEWRGSNQALKAMMFQEFTFPSKPRVYHAACNISPTADYLEIDPAEHPHDDNDFSKSIKMTTCTYPYQMPGGSKPNRPGQRSTSERVQSDRMPAQKHGVLPESRGQRARQIGVMQQSEVDAIERQGALGYLMNKQKENAVLQDANQTAMGDADKWTIVIDASIMNNVVKNTKFFRQTGREYEFVMPTVVADELDSLAHSYLKDAPCVQARETLRQFCEFVEDFRTSRIQDRREGMNQQAALGNQPYRHLDSIARVMACACALKVKNESRSIRTGTIIMTNRPEMFQRYARDTIGREDNFIYITGTSFSKNRGDVRKCIGDRLCN